MKKALLVTAGLALALFLGGCRGDRLPGLKMPESSEAISPANRVIYEVNVYA